MATRAVLVVAGCSVILTGCAGTLGQVMNPPISSDHLDDKGELNKLKTLSGDRRLVRVVAEGEHEGFLKYDICAETQADAISARSAKSALSVKEAQSLSDEAAEALTKTVDRSELSDVVRQLSWTLCNARLNDDLKVEEYRDAILALSYNALVVLQQRAIKDGVASNGAAQAKTATPPGTLVLVPAAPK